MREMTATYSPEDNKLRLSSMSRLDKETYERVKAAGFAWAPQQKIFVAPMWTPEREDLLIELCEEIDDEDTSLVDRAEQRAERFEEYSENRERDAHMAKAAVDRIADGIPLGQPILVGHHSERHARRDAKKRQGLGRSHVAGVVGLREVQLLMKTRRSVRFAEMMRPVVETPQPVHKKETDGVQ